jgi:uncharacterized membrane protein
MKGNFFLKLHPLHRVLISAGVSGLVFLLTQAADLTPLIRVMLLWDTFALVYTITCWIVIFRRPVEDLMEDARKEDGSRTFVFAFIVLACFASMLMVLLLMLSDEASETDAILYLPIAVFGILSSWGMVHTMFALHYAHIYYDDDENGAPKEVGGLDFPNEDKPDYLDFAYFSFVVGMTFQVSDVSITSRTLRRIALLHGFLSFMLNTFVVALTINLVAGLRN